jgi:hypothetical protein
MQKPIVPVFTPDDEPYLGRELLFAFDNLICACMELNSKCAAASHTGELSKLQHAFCILVPQTISLSLSIRELIRQGYLFGAKVLVRPLTERAVTILYLWHNPAAIQIWDNGWEHNKRPTLQAMMEYLNQHLLKGKHGSLREPPTTSIARLTAILLAHGGTLFSKKMVPLATCHRKTWSHLTLRTKSARRRSHGLRRR